MIGEQDGIINSMEKYLEFKRGRDRRKRKRRSDRGKRRKALGIAAGIAATTATGVAGIAALRKRKGKMMSKSGVIVPKKKKLS